MKAKVLVLDATSRPSLAACRALGRAGHEVAAAGHAAAAIAGASRYTARYHRLPGLLDDGSEFAAALERLAAEFGYEAMFATDDGTLAHLHRLRPPIPTVPTFGDPFALLTDKVRLAELARRSGVDYPPTYLAHTPEHLDRALGSVRYPAIVKAERSGVATGERLASSQGATVAHDEGAARAAVEALDRDGLRPIVQERVGGTEKTNVVVLRRDGRSEVRYAHRVLRENPPEGGIGVTLETLAPEDPRAARSLEALERVCEAAGYEGLAQAELYLSEERAWLIDVNPRLWGSTWFAERLGLRVVERSLRFALGRAPLDAGPAYPAGERFHHLPGELRSALRERPVWSSLLRLARSYRPGDYVEYADWSDPGPLLRLLRG